MTEPATLDARAPTNPAVPVTLADLAPGTACVMAVVVRPEETQLRLGYPGGRRVTVAAPGVPSLASDPWPTTMRPVAVRISARGGSLTCSVLATTPSGPARVAISVAQALSWCVSGVHAVLSVE
jgi:hypothetical protein